MLKYTIESESLLMVYKLKLLKYIFHQGTGKWLTTNTIASTIIEELIRVADALKGTNISAEELRERLLDATRNALKKQDYDHGLFRDFGTNSVDVADIVVHKLNQNEALQRALPCDGDTTYHAIAKIVMDWGGWIHGAARERSN